MVAGDAVAEENWRGIVAPSDGCRGSLDWCEGEGNVTAASSTQATAREMGAELGFIEHRGFEHRVHNGAADQLPDGGLWRRAREYGVQGVFAEVLGGGRSLEAEVDVAVVDAAGIDGQPAVRAGGENRHLRGGDGMAEANEGARGILKGNAAGVKGGLVSLDL